MVAHSPTASSACCRPHNRAVTEKSMSAKLAPYSVTEELVSVGPFGSQTDDATGASHVNSACAEPTAELGIAVCTDR